MTYHAKSDPDRQSKLVFLDGVDVTNHCLAYDDEQGWIERLQRDEQGTPVWLNGKVLRERVFGKIDIHRKRK